MDGDQIVTRPIAYDLSRLAARGFSGSPNGIDRVDHSLASLLAASDSGENTGTLLTSFKPVVLNASGVKRHVALVGRNWRFDADPADDDAYRAIKTWLMTPAPLRPSPVAHVQAAKPSRAGYSIQLALAIGTGLWPPKKIARDSVFLHATHFPDARQFSWLRQRSDIRPVFFVHDLLPLKFPHFFTEENAAQYRAFLDNVVAFAAGVITNTSEVGDDIAAFLRARGRTDCKVCVAPMPAAPEISAVPDPDLAAVPYFVMCGTIEPRKNHNLILDCWRELAKSKAAPLPRLVIVGRRGWRNEDILARLNATTAEGAHILEVSDLATPAMATLIASARGLLMPSHGEGYGLPVIEALALNTRVVASDLAVFREVAGARVAFCPLEDPAAWLAAIRDHAATMRAPPAPGPEEAGGWAGYRAKLEALFEAL